MGKCSGYHQDCCQNLNFVDITPLCCQPSMSFMDVASSVILSTLAAGQCRVVFMFNMFKPSQSTVLNHQTDWFQFQPFSNVHDTLTRNQCQNLCQKKRAPVSDVSDMQFGTKFFWYKFLVTCRTCSIFVPVYGTSFLV